MLSEALPIMPMMVTFSGRCRMKLKDSVAVMVFAVDTHGLDCPMDFCRNPRSSMCSGMLAASDDLSIVHLGTGAMQVPVLRAQMVMSGDRDGVG